MKKKNKNFNAIEIFSFCSDFIEKLNYYLLYQFLSISFYITIFLKNLNYFIKQKFINIIYYRGKSNLK